jgi:hypothetical protein
MINLTQQERDALHAKNGSREEFYKIELLDRQGVKKCDIELVDGTIAQDSTSEIQKIGTLKYRVPSIVRKVETVAPNANAILMSVSGKLFNLGVETNGLIYTVEIQSGEATNPSSKIKVQDDGLLFTENIIEESTEYELIDQDGYTWIVGVDEDGYIYSMMTDYEQKIYYRNEEVKVDFLNDRVRVLMGVRIGRDIKWWSQGLFLHVKPNIKNGMVSTQIFDESLILKKTRILESHLFLKGTSYVEVLSFFITYCGILKVDIEPTDLVLQTDIVVDDTKNNLEWFNYFASQINYTNLSVDNDGYFVSRKYREPSPLNVGYTYDTSSISVITGDIDAIMDNYNIPNIFRRIVSHPQLGELVSTYINEDPTDPYSVKNTYKHFDKQTVDNIASQEELDNLTRKAAFYAKQITQEISFYTLNMPHHGSENILDLRHHSAKGIVVERAWTMTLKAGAQMEHKAKRLVNLND